MPLGVGFAVTREWGFLFISISWECCKRGVSVLGLFYAHMALWHVLLCLFSGGMYVFYPPVEGFGWPRGCPVHEQDISLAKRESCPLGWSMSCTPHFSNCMLVTLGFKARGDVLNEWGYRKSGILWGAH